MTKLNRRMLRTVLLREMKALSEQTSSRAALSNLHKKSEQEYARAYKAGGIIGLAFSMIIGLPLESMIGAGNLLRDPEVQQKLEDTYKNEGIDATYTLWLNMLSEEMGL